MGENLVHETWEPCAHMYCTTLGVRTLHCTLDITLDVGTLHCTLDITLDMRTL